MTTEQQEQQEHETPKESDYTPEQLAEAEAWFQPFRGFRNISRAGKAQFYFATVKNNNEQTRN